MAQNAPALVQSQSRSGAKQHCTQWKVQHQRAIVHWPAKHWRKLTGSKEFRQHPSMLVRTCKDHQKIGNFFLCKEGRLKKRATYKKLSITLMNSMISWSTFLNTCLCHAFYMPYMPLPESAKRYRWRWFSIIIHASSQTPTWSGRVKLLIYQSGGFPPKKGITSPDILIDLWEKMYFWDHFSCCDDLRENMVSKTRLCIVGTKAMALNPYIWEAVPSSILNRWEKFAAP